MKTFSAKAAEVKRDWYVVDADGRRWVALLLRLHYVFVANTNQNTRRMLIPVITLLLLTQKK